MATKNDEEERAKRFIWNEGDIEILGHEELTADEKRFIKRQRD